MRFRTLLAVAIVPLLSVIWLVGSEMPGSDETDRLPAVTELEKINFIGVNSVANDNPPYDEVRDARGLFVAYSGGSYAISKYREPVPTRGAQGVRVFRAASPAVVVIVVGSVKNDNFDPEGMGSGAIIDPRGYVLTNWHVIKDYSGAVVFLKPTNSSDIHSAPVCVARVIYQDPAVDLALLRMADPPSTLRSLPVGDIAQVQIAEDVHIIGHPHGNLWSYSTGVVSQIRDRYGWSYEDGSRHLAKVLQLQTAINPGNSGGPVVDDAGNIIGLVAMYEEGQNLDYAIAADVIRRFLFTGMNMSTRGAAASVPPSTRPRQVFSGNLGTSLLVWKFIYPDAILYSIRERGKDVGLVAKFNDGMVIRAWNPDANSEFKAWSARPRNGSELVAAASGGALTSISMKQ